MSPCWTTWTGRQEEESHADLTSVDETDGWGVLGGVLCASGYLETHAPRWASSPSTTPSTSTTCRRNSPSRRCWWCPTSTVRLTVTPPPLSSPPPLPLLVLLVLPPVRNHPGGFISLSPLDVFIPSHDSLMVNLKESKEVTFKIHFFFNAPEHPGRRATVSRRCLL